MTRQSTSRGDTRKKRRETLSAHTLKVLIDTQVLQIL